MKYCTSLIVDNFLFVADPIKLLKPHKILHVSNHENYTHKLTYGCNILYNYNICKHMLFENSTIIETQYNHSMYLYVYVTTYVFLSH